MREIQIGGMRMAANWKDDWKEDLGKTIVGVVIGSLWVIGLLLLVANGRNFWMAAKPGTDIAELMENGGAREGMHVTGQVPYVYDCFANLSDSEGGDASEYYYALPSADGILILGVPAQRQEAVEALWEETWEYAADGSLPDAAVALEGYVAKAKGRLPYLLSEYLVDVLGYSQEEENAMGEPLLIRDAAEAFHRARIYAPVGMILLTSGILLLILYLSLRKRHLRKETGK